MENVGYDRLMRKQIKRCADCGYEQAADLFEICLDFLRPLCLD